MSIKVAYMYCGRVCGCDRILIRNLCFFIISNAHGEMRFSTATGQKIIRPSAYSPSIRQLGTSQPSGLRPN
jgi:hypothetical protein